jgi:hypothetical protein
MCPDEMPNLVGLSGRFGEWIDAVAPLCVATEASGRWHGQDALEPLGSRVGGDGGHPDSVVCPAGTFVLAWTAFTTRSQPDYVVGIELWCGTPTPNGAVATLWTSSAELAFNDALKVADVSCGVSETGIALTGTGIAVYSGIYVDRIALVCAPPRHGIGTIRQAGTAEPGQDTGIITRKDGVQPGSAYQIEKPGQRLTAIVAGGTQAATATGAPIDVELPAAPVLPGSQEYKPPLAKSGLRLYACQTVGGGVCKQPVADMFCQQQGFARADRFDTGKADGPAETIGGQQCTKKKCNVFDQIVCVR